MSGNDLRYAINLRNTILPPQIMFNSPLITAIVLHFNFHCRRLLRLAVMSVFPHQTALNSTETFVFRTFSWIIFLKVLELFFRKKDQIYSINTLDQVRLSPTRVIKVINYNDNYKTSSTQASKTYFDIFSKVKFRNTFR